MTVKTLMRTGLLLGVCLLLWPFSVDAETFGVYETWTSTFIRSDRWRGDEDFGGQEVAREVNYSHKILEMRYRLGGFIVPSTTPSGSFAASHRLNFAHPTSITEIAATFAVSDLTLTPCAANNAGNATRALPMQILLGRFNDGSGNAATGDRTGDHFGGIQAQRAGSSADLPGVLRVFGFINRCDNANCSTSTTLPGVVALGTVNVGSTSFTLQMIWDKPGNQFLFSLNGGTQHAVTYTASDSAEAILPFANINQRLIVANCHVARARADTTTIVGTVLTNSSAVIP